jgi:transposase
MSRLGLAIGQMSRITYEVLDQAFLFQPYISLDSGPAVIGRRPNQHFHERTIPMKRLKSGKPVLAKGRAVVGIDVGKRKHAATALTPNGEMIAQLASFPSIRQGIDLLEKEVLRKAGGPQKTLVAMEATGHYWMCLYHELKRRGYVSVVLNPVQTNAHARAQIRKNRNDRIDSVGIAQLVLAGEAHATRVPDEKTAELRLWVRHRGRLLRAAGNMERFAHTLVDRVFPEYAEVLSKPFLPSGQALIRQCGLAPDDLTAREVEVRKVLHDAGRGRIAPETIDHLLQAAKQSIGTRQTECVARRQLVMVFDCLATLRRQIAAIENELDLRMQEIDSPLFSLGITANLAAAIHAESDPIGDFGSADQYVAYAGLDPSSYRSGDTIDRRGKISKRGSPTLRRALYLAAFVVSRKHVCFQRIYQKHRRQGKNHCNALVIVARHLARVIWRLLTDGREFSKRPPQNTLPPRQTRRKAQ